MKKIIRFIIISVLMMSLYIPANAAGGATLNGGSAATAGGNIEFTVSVSGCSDATSVAVSVTPGNHFELVSGTWLKSGSLSVFDNAKSKGSLGGLSSPDINGNLFKLVLKAKTASANNQTVSVNVIAKNGANEILNATPSKSVKINCASHSYSAYTRKDNSNHTRTCTVCGAVETKAHTWNGGSVTKAANCKETGTKTFTCTACGATKTETIAKTNNHTYGAWTQTKAPTCTAKGTEARTCSVCQRTETRDIAATGHNMSAWKTTKEAGCETKGEQTRTCSKCNYKETKTTEALGHKFSKSTVTKQPTCTEAGTETGKCTVCGKETSNVIKALGHDFGNWTDTKAATCTEKGVQERKCSRCDATEKRETNPLGHDFEKPVIVKQPTLTEKGIEEGVCKRCGEKTTAEIPCTFRDENTGISITPEEGAFGQGTEIKIDVIGKESDRFEAVKSALGDTAEDFVAYEVTATLNQADVQPNKPVTASFKIPEGYGKNVAVFHIQDDGTAEQLESTVSEDGTTVTAALSRLHSYAIVKLADEKPAANAEEKADSATTGSSGNMTLIIAIIGAAILIAAIVAVILVKKKKAD